MALARRKPLRAQPRSKGNRAEREIIDLYHAFGWTGARRNWQSGGQGGGDIIGGPADTSTEVKHHEACRIWDWIRQCEADARSTDLPLLAMRRNRSSWWAVVPAHEWDALRELQPRSTYTLRYEAKTVRLWALIDDAIANAPAVAADAIPTVRFRRIGPGMEWKAAVPLEELLALLRLRENA